MTTQQMKKVVEHQVLVSLNDRELSIRDIGSKQYMKELYEMAIKLLVKLR